MAKLEKVLVTGGAGYVGSILVPLLLDAGRKVRVVDNLMYDSHTLLPYIINPNFEFIKGDLTKEKVAVKAMKDMDAIIHLAAIVGYPACLKSPELASSVNVGITRNLYRNRNSEQPILFASTGSNYGRVDGICTEETPLNPLTDYGKTKTKAEQELLEQGNVIVYRFATAFGISPRLRLDLMVNDFVFQALRNRQLIVYEKHVRRTFIHVKDMARSFLFALENLEKMRDEVYNVGHKSMNFTKEDIARLIREKIDYYLHFAEIGEDLDKRDYEVSYEKIRALGFTTQITIDRGLDELITGMQMVRLENPYSNV
jgi:nucleoside-diphosphate-sugar epimerase